LLAGFLWLALDPLSAFEPTLQMTIILMIEIVGLLITVIHLRKNANRYYQQLSI
jgi:low affinity Fe/Cu permease